MESIGIGFARTCDSSWASVEPQEGRWTWGTLDGEMRLLTEHRIAFGTILFGTVPWNKQDDPGSLPVNNLSAWTNYVSEVAKHVKGKSKYFEVWNEPPNFIGPHQTAADYAKIVVATYDVVKAVDPNALVGIEAKSVDINFLDQTIKDGAKGHFDYVIFHPYEVLGGVAEDKGTEAIYMSIVPTVRKMLAERDPEKINAPIMFTELGYDAKRSANTQAYALVKAYTMGIAQGVDLITWFEGMDGDSGEIGLLDSAGKPRPSYMAMAQMIRYFGLHPTYLGWVLLNKKDYGFVFQGATTTVLCTWAFKGTPSHVVFGRVVQVVEPLTGKTSGVNSCDLTTAPIFVTGVPTTLVAEARANREKPFPWDGNYSNAKSVSITMGKTVVEKGLHSQSADSIAADLVTYEGSGRPGDVPGGNVFMVDPNFLSYTSTPIEVSLVVRRNPGDDEAGFKLVYESTNGFKDCGWYTIPDNKEWHTVKWKITDAQFVSMWNYNFLLDSDDNKYGKYSIQSVKVTKLTR